MTPKPCNRFRAVASLVAKRIKLTLRTAAPPHILDRHVISVARKPNGMRVNHCGSDVASIRLAHQQRRPRSLPWRVIVIGYESDAIAEATSNSPFQANSISTIDQRHPQTPCLGSKLYMAMRISAISVAASFDHRSPLSAVAADGSPNTPLGAMSLVSHAKFADEPSGFSNSG